MATDSVIKIGNEEYEQISEYALQGSRWLVNAWENLGKPDSPLSDSGTRLMNAIIAAWTELYPDEYKEWIEDRKDYKLNELSITEQVHKHTGRSLASYPYFIFTAMKTLFPNFKPAQRENCMKMISKFPLFQMANKR